MGPLVTSCANVRALNIIVKIGVLKAVKTTSSYKSIANTRLKGCYKCVLQTSSRVALPGGLDTAHTRLPHTSAHRVNRHNNTNCHNNTSS
eukprot:6197631-Pyramimonas_sp.AAC.1